MTDPARESADKSRSDWAEEFDKRQAERDRVSAEYSKLHSETKGVPLSQVFAEIDREASRRNRAGCAIVVLASAALCFVIANGCSVRRSDGDRFGVITKLSRRGVVRDTWEGEAIIGSIDVPGVGTTWTFTVDDNGPINSVRSAMESGKKVRIHYIEYLHRGLLNGDTNYRVTGIEGAPK